MLVSFAEVLRSTFLALTIYSTKASAKSNNMKFVLLLVLLLRMNVIARSIDFKVAVCTPAPAVDWWAVTFWYSDEGTGPQPVQAPPRCTKMYQSPYYGVRCSAATMCPLRG